MSNLLEVSRKNPFSNPHHQNVSSSEVTRRLSCASGATGMAIYSLSLSLSLSLSVILLIICLCKLNFRGVQL